MAGYSAYTDLELVALLQRGDRAAFTEIYERHWQSLLHTAQRILNDKEACMDLLQEVFVWLWTHREEAEPSSLKGYLTTAVKYQVANFIRNSKVRDKYILHTESLGLTEVYEDDPLELKELKEVITKVTATLPARCQEVFNLSRNEHKSNKEIAGMLGISEKTVEMQITIALKRLKTEVKKHSALLNLFL